MKREELISIIHKAGIVGSGGAGFPTHAKYSGPLETLIINGAECEPLLWKDKEILRLHSDKILEVISLMIELGFYKRGIIAVKKKAKEAVKELNRVINEKNYEKITIHTLDNFYPSGDEIVQICELTGKSVPYGKLPSYNGVVVNNSETYLNIYKSLSGESVTEKYITICGEVETPLTLKVPIGVRLSDCMKKVGKILVDDPVYMKNGVMMASFGDDFNDVITKTTAGYLILDRAHPLVRLKTEKIEVALKVGKSACDQCSYCTELCPRYLLGHKVKPHLVMRSLIFSPESMTKFSKWASGCVECGLCGLYSCPEGLKPHLVMSYVKKMLKEKQLMFEPDEESSPHAMRDYRKTSVKKLMRKLSITKYDQYAPFKDYKIEAELYYFPMNQNIGVPSKPVVNKGDFVKKGEYIGVAQKGLSTYIASSVDGIVEYSDEKQVIIRRKDNGK